MTEIEARYAFARAGFILEEVHEGEQPAMAATPGSTGSQDTEAMPLRTEPGAGYEQPVRPAEMHTPQMKEEISRARSRFEKDWEEIPGYWVTGCITYVGEVQQVGRTTRKRMVAMQYYHNCMRQNLAFEVVNANCDDLVFEEGTYMGVMLTISAHVNKSTGIPFPVVQCEYAVKAKPKGVNGYQPGGEVAQSQVAMAQPGTDPGMATEGGQLPRQRWQ